MNSHNLLPLVSKKANSEFELAGTTRKKIDCAYAVIVSSVFR